MTGHDTAGDQRRFSRLDIDARADLEGPVRVEGARVVDISLHGLLLDRPEGWPVSPGDPARVTIRVTDGPVIEMTMAVVYVKERRLGCRCSRIEMDSFAQLKRLVELNLGDPDLLHRELEAMG